jgi:hypothetical protein
MKRIPIVLTLTAILVGAMVTNAHAQPVPCENLTPESRVLSPDGTQIAYTVQPQMVTDALAREGGIGGGQFPSDIHLCNLSTGELSVIAPQPQNAAFFTPNMPDNALLRSAPAWSPDGSMLAWLEMDYPPADHINRLVVYDVATYRSRTIAELPGPLTPGTFDLTWPAEYIAVHSIDYSVDEAGTRVTLLYDVNGNLIDSVVDSGAMEPVLQDTPQTADNGLITPVPLPPPPVQNQPPMTISQYGQLFTWSGYLGDAPQPLSTCQPEGEQIRSQLLLSPDGTRIAFKTWDRVSVEAVEREGGIGGGDLYGNIWICDLTTGTLKQAANQPMNTSLLTPGVPDLGVVRSIPSWSPDGTSLAWSELRYPIEGDAINHLVTYNIEADSITPVADFPISGVPVPIDPKWGSAGIAVHLANLINPDDTDFSSQMVVYDTLGNILSSTTLQSEGDVMWDYEWVSDSDQSFIAVLYHSGEWQLIDPFTGSTRMLEPGAVVEIFNPVMPYGASAYVVTYSGTDLPIGFEWFAVYPNNTSGEALIDSLEFQGNLMQHPIPSPDGQSVFYQSDLVYRWQNGEILPAQIPSAPDDPFASAVWTPTAWRIRRGQVADDDSPPAAVTCPGTLPSRLVVGAQGLVTPGEPNNMRDQATTDSTVIAQIPSGGTFTVLEGPVCGDNMAWWMVDYEGIRGWTAEGDINVYWLEPIA